MRYIPSHMRALKKIEDQKFIRPKFHYSLKIVISTVALRSNVPMWYTTFHLQDTWKQIKLDLNAINLSLVFKNYLHPDKYLEWKLA